MYNFKVRSKLENLLKHIGLLMSIVGLLVACISIVFIGINIKAIENQNTIAINTERNVRFSTAIEQLGSGETAITQGAIYTLHRIAQEDENYVETVFTIFCAYVRDTTSTVAYQEKYFEKPAETIQAIVNLLTKGKNKEVYDSFIIDFTGAHLAGIDFDNAELKNAILAEANCTKASFIDTNLMSVQAIFSDFSGCYFHNTNFTNASIPFSEFSDSYMESVNFAEANLGHSDFIGIDSRSGSFFNSNLSFANLSKINASKIDFTKADLSYTIFIGATLAEGNFTEADLSSADLRASNLYKAIFKETNLSNADLKGVDTTQRIQSVFTDDFIRSRIGKTTDLSGIIGGYSEMNPPFVGVPILGFFTIEEAEQIINPKTLQEILTGLNDDFTKINSDLQEINEGLRNLIEKED